MVSKRKIIIKILAVFAIFVGCLSLQEARSTENEKDYKLRLYQEALESTLITNLVVEMDYIDKAVTLYYLDTSSFPTQLIKSNGMLRIQDLLSNDRGIKGWSGPYLKDPISDFSGYLENEVYGKTYIFANEDTPWDNPAKTESRCKSGSKQCSLYVCITDVPEKIIQGVDYAVDKQKNEREGRIRFDLADSVICMKGLLYSYHE